MNHVAPEGTVFVCGACGKRSRDRYGDQAIDRGWDVSCSFNCVLAKEDHLVMRDGLVAEIRDGGLVETAA